jgi:hypothetical protein
MTTENKTLSEQIIESNKTAQTAAEEAALPPVDYKALYEQKSEEVDSLNAIITASRAATRIPANQSHKPSITAERFRAQVGDVAFLNMTRAQKLMGVGVDPATPDDVLHQGWGRGNDGKFAQDLMKSDPKKYSSLRQAAIVLGIFGAKK